MRIPDGSAEMPVGPCVKQRTNQRIAQVPPSDRPCHACKLGLCGGCEERPVLADRRTCTRALFGVLIAQLPKKANFP